MILLFTDTHLDEQPQNEYRWRVFGHVREAIKQRRVQKVYGLGDMWDRKDRFSGQFVNRLIEELRDIGHRVPLDLLKGNHDDPLHGPAFFEFINGMVPGVRYITSPTPDGKIILLPFTPTPMETWRGIKFSEFDAALMHVTVTGAISESGYQLTGPQLPILPRSLRLYSGDVHNPQSVRNLTYVGCPHPVKFGDKFKPRMLLLDDAMEIAEEINPVTPRKLVLEGSTLEEVLAAEVSPGDQVRIRLSLTSASTEEWSRAESAIAAWAAERGVTVASTEIAVEGPQALRDVDQDLAPDAMLRLWAGEEEVASDLRELGLELLREAQGAPT